MNSQFAWACRRLVLFAWLGLYTFAAFAQEEVTTKVVKTSTTTNTWYASPWVWVAGAAVFILLLVALLRGGGSSSTDRTERLTVTKTTSTDV